MYTDQQKEIALIAKVFGHPARVAILQQLFKIDACYCGDLSEEIGLAQPTISQHLKELKTIGIIQGSIEGKSVCYCIDEKVWKQFQEEFNGFFNQDVNVKQCC